MAAVLTVWVAAACASGSAGRPSPQDPAHGDRAAEAKARADSARYPYTAADVRFMSGMIGHHAQALVMARLAPTHGANRSVQILAERIINAQQDEIAIMQQWLRDRRQPVPEPTAATTMVMNGVEHEMLMPGMRSARTARFRMRWYSSSRPT
jgi:hypothetical protein